MLASFKGEFGSYIEKELLKLMDFIRDYNCFYYDSGLLTAHAVDYLVRRGFDYEDGELLNKTIRETRIEGCSGLVAISSDTNDRKDFTMDIFNLRKT